MSLISLSIQELMQNQSRSCSRDDSPRLKPSVFPASYDHRRRVQTHNTRRPDQSSALRLPLSPHSQICQGTFRPFLVFSRSFWNFPIVARNGRLLELFGKTKKS